ncbi:MAG TPA: nucleoside diphosphate kinase regulator [Croceibacterium sp.]|nr:nucleoside diphosphate kinase regulator [Croceibacterium sp.]
MQTELSRGTRPPLTLADDEAETLADLAVSLLDRSPQLAEMLLQEIDRAETFPPAELPADVVTMMSRVTFVDEGSGKEHSVELVYPKDANMAENRISVLTPVGVALVGMRRGNSIDWPNLQGAVRRLRIVEVVQPECG